MARYAGPKARINRRLGSQIYESAGAIRAAERRDHPPGMRTRVRRPSNYGAALMEKQKIKHYYGLGERQLRKYFDKAGRQKGNTGENLLMLLERRLDNVVLSSGFSLSPLNRRRLANFKANRRGYWSFWIFLVVFLLSLFAEFIANDKPLLVRYDGGFYMPVVTSYPETVFGGEFDLEADYHDPFIQELIEEKGWMVCWI